MYLRAILQEHKCDQYWPDLGESKHYGKLNVTCVTEDQYADFTVRSFVVTQVGYIFSKFSKLHFITQNTANLFLDKWQYVCHCAETLRSYCHVHLQCMLVISNPVIWEVLSSGK